MWNRACPLCFAKVPRTLVLTRGEELLCPSCRTPLELSRPSRVFSAVLGLAAGFVAAHVVFDSSATGRWLLPMIGAILAYGVASALTLYYLSDLVVQPKAPAGHFPQTHK